MKELGDAGHRSRALTLWRSRRSVETIPRGPCGSMAVLAGEVTHSAVMGCGPLVGPCRCLLLFHFVQTKVTYTRAWHTHTHTGHRER